MLGEDPTRARLDGELAHTAENARSNRATDLERDFPRCGIRSR